jgi:acetoin utilization protein AcuB
MLVADLMTTHIFTVNRETPVLEALKIMQEHGFRRLPVVDEDFHPVGVVSQKGIENLKPQSGIPSLWQIGPWAAKHTVADAMTKKMVTVHPADTVEHATQKAQDAKVGSLLVVDDGKLVGIVTTNDIFYKVVNPTLGIGEPGSRIVIAGGGSADEAGNIISCLARLGATIRVIWALVSASGAQKDLVVHLDVEDARNVVGELARLGYDARIINR